MIIKAQQKNIPVTPRKLQLMANAVKHMSPTEAVALLEMYNKKSALHLSKVLKQAIANATNNQNIEARSLRIQHILMGRGMSLKRFRAGARGRGKPYERVRSHVTVLLESVEAPAVKATQKTKPSTTAEPKTKKITKSTTKKTK
jgi:large subunit ribosomal protein L22